jgi:predicted RND superfamily exporter protein
MAVALRTTDSIKSLKDNARIVNLIENHIRTLDPIKYDSEMKTSLSGNIKQSVEEYETLKKDLFDTTALLATLILGIIFLFFWSVPLLALLSLTLISAVVWTFGLTYWQIGYLNSQTAFLGSIVVGTGINYGIIYLARVLEYLREGKKAFEATYLAVENSLAATLIASSTTAVSFASLLINENKGLSQFAFIGGIGVCLCWIISFSFLPLWTYLLLSKGWMKIPEHPFSKKVSTVAVKFSYWTVDRAWAVGKYLGSNVGPRSL